tara:strand:- start:768 stop:920 length:153 start_codon:yes stop_codon:yes gene_type:complete
MSAEIIECQWLPKDDDDAIEKYIRDGWDIRIQDDIHHGYHAVLAVRRVEE